MGDINAVAKAAEPERQVVTLDFANGFSTGGAKSNPAACLEQMLKPADQAFIFVLKDFHRFMDDPHACRLLRNISTEFKKRRSTVIITAPFVTVPSELQNDIYVIDYLLPDYEGILEYIKTLTANIDVDDQTLEALAKAFQGLTQDKIRAILAKALAKKGSIDLGDIDMVLDEKKQIIKQTEVLEYYPLSDNIDSIGGLDELKNWVLQRSFAFTQKAKEYGLPYPKGMLLVGVQGTGKSLCAKAIARQWNMPLLKLDLGRIMGKYVGESEGNIMQMIRTAEAMAPCTLWIDEIDKAFAGVTGYQGDSGVLARVFGTLITWMQEKTTPVFIAATANNIEHLPPELLRKGRFDEIFFVNLPTQREREQIFRIHLAKKRGVGVKGFDCERLASVSQGFSGAEIEQAVIDGMYHGFARGSEFTTADVEKALKETVPLSATMKTKIEILQNWAKSGHARLATTESENVFPVESEQTLTVDMPGIL